MINAQNVSEPQKTIRKATWMDTAQLVVSILVFIVLIAVSGLCFFALTQSPFQAISREFIPSLWALGFGMMILAVIALVSAIKSRQVYYERALKPIAENGNKWLYGIIVLLPILVLAAYFVFDSRKSQAFIIPLMTIVSLAIAMVWILRIGTGDKWAANVKRETGLFSFSMSFGTFIIMIVQILLVFILMFVTTMLFAQQTGFLESLQTLFENTQNYKEAAQQFADNLAKSQFGTVLGILGALAVVIILPFVEELFKTLGVWLLKGRMLSPSEGWVAGLMCGAGFGMIEAFLYSMQGVLLNNYAEWLYFVLGRTGGLLMHTFTGGLIGWALSKSWLEKRPGPAIGAYFSALGIHALWNFVAISQIIFEAFFKINVPDLAVYIVLGMLFIAVLLALFGMRRKIWREELEVRKAFDEYIVKILQDESLLIRQGK